MKQIGWAEVGPLFRDGMTVIAVLHAARRRGWR